VPDVVNSYTSYAGLLGNVFTAGRGDEDNLHRADLRRRLLRHDLVGRRLLGGPGEASRPGEQHGSVEDLAWELAER
jgi:hypothetical protein